MTYTKWQSFYNQNSTHKSNSVRRFDQSYNTNRNGPCHLQRFGQLNKKSKLTTIYTTKKEKQMHKTIN